MLDKNQRLTLERLTLSAFAPFGQLIDTRSASNQYLINGGTTERFHNLAQVAIHQADADSNSAQVGISIFRSQPRAFPFEIGMLERHPLGSQAFMPLQQQAYLVVVAPPLDNSQPDLTQLRAFYAEGNQGVNYAAGTWHHPVIAVSEVADFLVMDRIGSGNNCDEFCFPQTQYCYLMDSSYERF